ncbi:MAG TPA: hypothetical protein VLL27_03500 [Solirubrobacterales bacterium]|nr:hypothetical protein [Solirubrobacterales bacterium]
MSAAGVVMLPALSLIASLGDSVQSGLWAVAGAMLSVVIAVLLDRSGTLEQMRERRKKQKEKKAREEKEKEASESGGGPLIGSWQLPSQSVEHVATGTKESPVWTPGKDDLPPEDGSPFLAALRTLRVGVLQVVQGIKELLGLGLLIPWVALFYLLLLSGIFWLDPLMLRMGFSEDSAAGAVVADWALSILTGGWILTGIRTRKRSISVRILQTGVLVAVVLAAVALVVATGSFLYGGGGVFVGAVAYLKMFP